MWLMASVTYGKCYLWQRYYAKCNYDKSILANETEPPVYTSCGTQSIFVLLIHPTPRARPKNVRLKNAFFLIEIKTFKFFMTSALQIDLIPQRYPMEVIPCKDKFNIGIKYYTQLDIKIKHSRLTILHTIISDLKSVDRQHWVSIKP